MGIPQHVVYRKVRLSRIYPDFCNICQKSVRDSYYHFRNKHPMEFLAAYLKVDETVRGNKGGM